jgi:hypothetical protein
MNDERSGDHIEDLDVPSEEGKDVKGGDFVKLGDIKGESIDRGHNDTIQILSFKSGH